MWKGTSWRPGAASLLWLKHALQSMDADLRARYGAAAGIAFFQAHSHTSSSTSTSISTEVDWESQTVGKNDSTTTEKTRATRIEQVADQQYSEDANSYGDDYNLSAVESTLLRLVQRLGVRWVVASRRHEPAMRQTDSRCETTLLRAGVNVRNP